VAIKPAIIRIVYDENPSMACGDPECCGAFDPLWFVEVNGKRDWYFSGCSVADAVIAWRESNGINREGV